MIKITFINDFFIVSQGEGFLGDLIFRGFSCMVVCKTVPQNTVSYLFMRYLIRNQQENKIFSFYFNQEISMSFTLK